MQGFRLADMEGTSAQSRKRSETRKVYKPEAMPITVLQSLCVTSHAVLVRAGDIENCPPTNLQKQQLAVQQQLAVTVQNNGNYESWVYVSQSKRRPGLHARSSETRLTAENVHKHQYCVKKCTYI